MNYISSLLKQAILFKSTFGYITKYVREQVLKLPKSHYNDAVAIASDCSPVKSSNTVFYKRHVSSGDYQQTKGPHSNIRIPTGKLFGLRKFDLIDTVKGSGYISGKRSTGYFAIQDIHKKTVHTAVNVKKLCNRLQARSTTLITQGEAYA